MALSRSIFDTRDLPEKDRVSVWREAATSVWDIDKVDEESFHARVDAFHSGALVFGTVAGSAQVTRRDARHIARDGLEYYLFQFYVSGERQASARGRDETLSRGDLLVVDMSQPIATHSRNYNSLDMVVPRRLLEPLLRSPDGHGGQRLGGNLALVEMFRSHLDAFNRMAPMLSETQALTLEGPTLALAAAALNGVVAEEQRDDFRSATLLAIRRYIEARLQDLTLSPEQVAQAFGISRATLYRLLEPIGGFASHLRMRRLQNCALDLRDASLQYRTISQIAEAWGFLNASSFSRLFLQVYGQSPRDYRLGRERYDASQAQLAGLASWSGWLAAMK